MSLVSSCSHLVRSVGADGLSSWSSDDTALIRQERRKRPSGGQLSAARRNADPGGRRGLGRRVGNTALGGGAPCGTRLNPSRTLCWTPSPSFWRSAIFYYPSFPSLARFLSLFLPFLHSLFSFSPQPNHKNVLVFLYFYHKNTNNNTNKMQREHKEMCALRIMYNLFNRRACRITAELTR